MASQQPKIGTQEHVPVLAERCVALLAPAFGEDAVAIDGTLGLGGHTELLLKSHPTLRVIGIDRDQNALRKSSARLAHFADRFTPVHTTYDHIAHVAGTYGPVGGVDGILLDLGVSSMQLDRPERGFSYSQDAPLDMRMDQSTGITAAELLAEASAAEIHHILQRYGDEKFAGRIARRIVDTRETKPLSRTGELVDLLEAAIPAAGRRRGGHPAKRTFQALRIAVNSELQILSETVPAALRALRVGGRLVVMSYHSGEDRLVKRALAVALESSAPPDLPVELPQHRPWARALLRGAEKATASEIEENPRAASVRLRAVEITREQPPQETYS